MCLWQVRYKRIFTEEGLPLHPYLRATRTELSSGPLLMVSTWDKQNSRLKNSSLSPFS